MRKIVVLLCILFSITSMANDSLWVIKPEFDEVSPFSEGLAAVKQNGLYGYIDSTGKFVVAPKYEEAALFIEGLAAVKYLGKWGYIDKNNNWVIKAQYDEAYPFGGGLAPVKKGYTRAGSVTIYEKWGCINTKGQMVIRPEYEAISSFYNGYAVANYKGIFTIIDKKGITVASYTADSDTVKFNRLYNEISGYHNSKLIRNIIESKLVPMETNNKWGFQKMNLKNFLSMGVPTFEDYLSQNNLSPIEDFETYMKTNIEREVNQWQTKGEFETTSTWKERVNEETRNKLIEELSAKYQSEYDSMAKLYKSRNDELAKAYAEEYKASVEFYYRLCSSEKEAKFKNANYELMTYDADNETFLIKSDNSFGDILLPVPIGEAQNFKQNWAEIKRNIEPTFTPSGDDVVLTAVTFVNGNNQYVYDSKTEAKYAVTDINYNFEPMDISSLDLKREISYNFDEVEVLQNSVVQTAPKVKGIDSSNKNIEHKSLQANVQSDVDINIPQNKLNENSNTFALIIANEHYQNVTKVEHANNDGKLFAEYCEKTLGIPQKHIMLYDDATLGNMLGAINRIKDIGSAYNGNLNIIFYYAGHGIPDEESKDAFLLPVDGNASSPRTCYKQSELYSELAGIKAKSVMVFMDACFSGAQRGDGMLMASRGVAIKAKSTNPLGNMVVFSAAQGDETAYPYKEQKHGMFTYYLLKKLQETKGDVTLGELSDYVTAEVKKTSIVANGKMQTPTLLSSPQTANDWRNWKLR